MSTVNPLLRFVTLYSATSSFAYTGLWPYKNSEHLAQPITNGGEFTYGQCSGRIILGDAESSCRCVYCVENSFEDEGLGGEATILNQVSGCGRRASKKITYVSA